MYCLNLREDFLPKDILKVCEILTNNGFQAYIVGGSIRDIILKKQPKDWDITTNALPSEVMKVFKGLAKIIPTGLKHGTITIIMNGTVIEVTTFRTEKEYVDGRRPNEVAFIDDIEGDLARRDLTINAIAFDPVNKKTIDPFKGVNDIENKILKMVGNPDDRLKEDGLRLIRIFRFVSTLDFKIDEKTFNSIPNNLSTFDKVSRERIQTEFQKLISGESWFKSLVLVKESGLLYHLVPEIEALNSYPLKVDLNINRLDFTFRILAELKTKSSTRLRYAVLFHQISILKSKSTDLFPNYNENQIGKILRKMKFSNKQIEEICHVLRIHTISLPYKLLNQNEEQKNYQMRKFLFKIKPVYILDFLRFFRAKEQAIKAKIYLTSELEKDLLERSKVQHPINKSDLAINGDDIIHYFKINKTNASMREFIGLCLGIIRERVEFDLSMNKKDKIENILKRLNKIIFQCKIKTESNVLIISTDHIRNLYRNNLPDYCKWENEHTYQLAIWLILCLLRKKQQNIVIFDATNFNLPSHPHHRKKLAYLFKIYNPMFLHAQATEEETKQNLEIRKRAKPTIKSSDADLDVYYHYKKKTESYSNFLSIPKHFEMIKISSRGLKFHDQIQKLTNKIRNSNNRLIIMSGNVLSGKSFIAENLQLEIEKI